MAPSSPPASSIASIVLCTSRPSTSKRSGLRAVFSASCTDTARPSRTAIMPQHSLGKSRRAWATMRSTSSGAMSTPRGYRPRVLLLALDRGPLVVVALGLARERVLELAHALAQRLADLGQLLRAQHDEGDGEDDDELHRADVRHPISRAFEGRAADPTPVGRCAGAAGLPPDRGIEVLDLLHRLGVDAARQVLPAVVADDEDDVALVQLAGDPHRDRRDRAGRDADEHA